ncbi:MAG: prepilin peptidase [Arcobacteraceae bacterium]|nr:prepilin peptidase [Arcobacteraceae bacterium]
MEFSIFLIGLIFGSFLNMLIYRLPLGVSLIHPKRSICTSCNHTIKWYENLPILSYIFLKGQCSYCNEKISITYPIVELLTSVVTLVLFYKLGLNIDFIITTLLFYTFIVLSFIDFKYKAVPDYLLILALIISFFTFNFSIQNAFIFAGAFVLLELFVTFYIQNIKAKLLKDDTLKNQRAMGEGDIPIIAIIGGLLGIKLGIFAIFLAAVLAIIPALLNNIIKKDIETPFIPFLSLGLFIVYISNNYFLQLLGEIIK